jgi:hypothetical protein
MAPASISLPEGFSYTYKRLDVSIDASQKIIKSAPFTLDKSIEFVDAVSITSTNESAIFGLQHRLVISGNEVFPDEFAARLIFSYASTPPNDRFFDIGKVPAGNGSIQMSLYDNTDPADFGAYKVSFFFRCLQRQVKA